MQAKLLDRKKAVELRKMGYSYNEIRKKVVVSKSSLSLWLRSVGLTKKQEIQFTERKREAQKKAVAAWRQIRIDKTRRIKEKARSEIKKLSERERWLIGTALYWAEGAKEHERSTLIKFSNSDPGMIVFFREWLLDFLPVSPADLIYELQIHHKSPSITSAIHFWSKLLHIDISELRVTFKKHNPSPKRKNIGVNYRGLIRLVVRRSVDMNRKIAGWSEGICDLTNIIGE